MFHFEFYSPLLSHSFIPSLFTRMIPSIWTLGVCWGALCVYPFAEPWCCLLIINILLNFQHWIILPDREASYFVNKMGSGDDSILWMSAPPSFLQHCQATFHAPEWFVSLPWVAEGISTEVFSVLQSSGFFTELKSVLLCFPGGSVVICTLVHCSAS